MFVIASLITATAGVLNLLFDLYTYVIIGRAVISWVNPDPYNPIVRFLYRATEPVLHRVRRVLPDMGGIDLSPILVLLAIYFLKVSLIGSLRELAFKL